MGTVDDYLAELDPGDREAIEHVYADRARGGARCRAGHGLRDAGARVPRQAADLGHAREEAHRDLSVQPGGGLGRRRALEGSPGIGLDKGTIRFQPEHPLPDDVVRALVARSQGADRGLTVGVAGRQWGSTRLTPIAIMTTAMIASRMRQARGVESQRPR